MDAEKTKAKAHPFSGHLRPREEILWMSAPSTPSTGKQQVIAVGVVLVTVLAVMVFALFSDDKVPPEERMPILAVMMGIIVGLLAIWLVLRGLWHLITRSRLPERAYAITNERLLYRSKKDVSSIPLESVPSVSLFLGDGTKGTFSFGALFPMWPDVENAIEVKHMIDAAQKKRLREIDA